MQQLNYLIFNNNTGEILRNIICPEDTIELQIGSEDQSFMPVNNSLSDSLFYVDVVSKNILPRPTFSERIEGTNILDLPIPTTVTTNGSSYNITDGSAELSFSLPGTYRVHLSSFPYQEKVVEVTQA